MLVVAVVEVRDSPVLREETSMSEVVTTPGVRIVDSRPVPEPGTYEIDPSHQSFEFVARHLMARVRGRFSGVSGVATVAERPEDSTMETGGWLLAKSVRLEIEAELMKK
jgi:polyisoprenoid-binding protein YceI